jgi:hypothetical protein
MNETTEQSPKAATLKYKPRYIVRSKVKQFALKVAKSNPCETRAKMFTRVGTHFYEALDAVVANWIVSRVKSQPSKGKTLT